MLFGKCDLANYLSDFLASYLAILGELNGNFDPVLMA